MAEEKSPVGANTNRLPQSILQWPQDRSRIILLQRMGILLGVLFLATRLIASLVTQGLEIAPGAVIGGDYLAFYSASDLVLQGRALDAYDQAAFDAALQSHLASDNLGLLWQYPPVLFFLIAPLALLPYKLSYWLWMVATAAILALALRRLNREVQPQSGDSNLTLWVLMASPIIVGVFVNGQISLLTTALLITAAYRPKTHWVLAGVCAGLLTIKPQLGVIIPFAYLAVGAWRTFGVAALVAITIHGLSAVVFGAESFPAFLSALDRIQTQVATGGADTPPYAMTTLFAQLRIWGVSGTPALWAHIAFAIAVMTFVTWQWRIKSRADGQSLYLAALLCSAAILITPYAYAYELAALAPAGLWIACTSNRWKDKAAFILIVFWLTLTLRRMIPSDFVLSLSFLVAIGAFGLIALGRRSEVLTKQLT
ncbi:MAG: glycosyltransferase family 87 protein [Pseudomonadota bacterium]